jgi:hypothetical protein
MERGLWRSVPERFDRCTRRDIHGACYSKHALDRLGALPFVPLVAAISINVWREPFDLARALTPVFTAAPFLLAVAWDRWDAPFVARATHQES